MEDKASFTGDLDTVLVAAPMRSGQTWLCYMLAHLLNARTIEPYCLMRGIVYTGNKYVRKLTQGGLPDRAESSYALVVKTHEYPDPNYSLTRKIILLARDPRDMALSAALRYHVMKTTGTDVEEDARELVLTPIRLRKPRSLKDRVWHLVYGCRLFAITLTARKWGIFYEAWRQIPFCHVVTFESLLNDPEETLLKICAFLEVPADRNQIQAAIEALSMKEISKHQKGTDSKNNIEFRKGKIGDHKGNLSRIELAVIRHYCRKAASGFGYHI